MKALHLIPMLFLSGLLLISCKKDDPVAPASVYGKWTDDKPGMFRQGREWRYFYFKEPDYCKLKVEKADDFDHVYDSLKLEIKNDTLHVFVKSGFSYLGPAHIEKITNSELHLKSTSGITVLYRYSGTI